MRRLIAAGLAAAAGWVVTAPALGDSFTPVTLSISVTPVARARAPLHIAVTVTADPGALDTRSAPLRVRVRLASECGGTFAYTSGPVLLDQRLRPQPATGHAYRAVARGSGRPTTYGSMTVCTWLQDEGDNRVFASDQSVQVNVSRACTVAAGRYDADRRRHRGRAMLIKARNRARRACGPGVPV